MTIFSTDNSWITLAIMHYSSTDFGAGLRLMTEIDENSSSSQMSIIKTAVGYDDDVDDDSMVGCDADIPYNPIHNRGQPKKYHHQGRHQIRGG